MNSADKSYNLLAEPWIPILGVDGNYSRVGIKEALAHAHRIRQIAASNPMDRMAILRFLLAVLYWCKGSPPGQGPISRMKSFPTEWFSALGKNTASFNLLDKGRRFYQDATARRPRTTTDLLQEIPSGNNFWHFRHSTDGVDGLCLACCAMGLLRLPMFSVSGLPDLKSGINGTPPIYIMQVGNTLFETLLANWKPAKRLGAPSWLKPIYRPPSGKAIPVLVGLTMLSRRVWLHDPGQAGTCIACGDGGRALVRSCECQSAGEQKSEHWDDPHVVYSDAKPRKASKAADLTAARRFRLDRPWPYLLADVIAGSKFNSGNKPVTLFIVGFATDKAKNIDAWERTVEIPPADASSSATVSALKQWNSEGKRLENRVARAKVEGAAIMAAVRPDVEARISTMAGGLLSGGYAPWERAASEYRSILGTVSRALSPGFSSKAVQRRRQIARATPWMRPAEDTAKKSGRDKGSAQ